MDVLCPLGARRCGTFHKGRFTMPTSVWCREHSPSTYRRAAEFFRTILRPEGVARFHSGRVRRLTGQVSRTPTLHSLLDPQQHLPLHDEAGRLKKAAIGKRERKLGIRIQAEALN